MAKEYVVSEKKIHTGFVAQEVEKAAQDLKYDFDGVNHPQNEKDNYSLVYADFVPSLVKAVQELSTQNEKLRTQNDEQQKINTDLQTTNDDLQKQINELKTMFLSGNKNIASENINTVTSAVASLEQNTPNPFSQSATIAYILPSRFSSAKIILTDNSGKTIKQFTLSAPGKGQVHAEAGALAAGMYNYTLYVDNKFIDSKKMEIQR